MDISQIITEAGSYYRDGGQGAKDILNRFRQRIETDAIFSDVATTRDTVVRRANAITSSVLQAFQKQWTPKGQTTFKMENIELFEMKVDIEEHPDALVESWLGFLEGEEELDRAKWPFVKWWLENQIMPQMDEDYEVYEVFHGIFAEPTPGTPGVVGKSMDGLNILRKRHIASGKIAPLIVGAVPTTDAVLFVKYMENMAKMVPKILQSKIQPFNLSQTLGQLYVDGIDELYNGNYKRIEDKLSIKNTPMRIVSTKDPESGFIVPGLRSHEGSNVIHATVKGNSVLRRKNPGNIGMFKIESQTRQVKAYTDFWKGVGWWYPSYVFTNNVETALPV